MEGLSLRIISEEHVLCVVVDQIALLFTEILLGDKPSDSQLVDDLQDVKLRIESSARLALELVLVVFTVAAAEAPRAGKVLFPAESPYTVVELLAFGSLSTQVGLEISFRIGWMQGFLMLVLVLLIVNIVVEFLGHGVV